VTKYDFHDQQVRRQHIANRDMHLHYHGDGGAGDDDDDSLTAALALLDSIPLEEIPEPTPLPSRSRMPLRHNPLFVGREDDLRFLARTLRGERTAAIGQLVAASGMGGIGKTQLAVEFAHRYGRYFAGGVFWLNFGDPQSIPSDVALCGAAPYLHLSPQYGDLSLEQQIGLVRAAWESPLPRLLIFDNCEDEVLLRHWRPNAGGSRVLVTSRRGEFNPGLGVYLRRLDVLPRWESIDLLRKHVGARTTDADLDAIAEELGDLPLAVEVAGSYLAVYRDIMSPAGYLSELRSTEVLEHPSLQGEGTDWLPTEHERDVGRTFLLSYQRLKDSEPADILARKLLARAACFAPGEPIPRALLLQTLALPDEDQQQARQAVKGLQRLIALGLLTEVEEGAQTAGEGVRLHRLLARFVKRAVSDDEAQPAVEDALGRAADELNRAGYPLQLLPLQPHLRSIVDRAPERADEQMAWLCNQLGYHLGQLGEYTQQQQYHERSLAIREEVLGPSHPDTATSLNSLAATLNAQGRYSEAQPLYERALAIREEVLGPSHPDTATSLNNLAANLNDQGRYSEAQPLYERALAICEEVLGPIHPATAASLNNLAANLNDQGRYSEAQPLYERALAIREEVLGPTHPDTATSLNNLAMNLNDQGRYSEAQPLYERSLAIYEEVLGPTHPNTAQSLNNLASTLDDQGRYSEAQPLYERSLAIREEVLGPIHPATAASLNNLAANLNDQGRYSEVQPLLERAVMIYEKVLGPNHPHTELVRDNLIAVKNRRTSGDHGSDP
jgi:tetratricopeptide (TPR) repeat protein